MAGNLDAWQVYQTIQSQVLIAPSGKPFAINHMAIWAYLDHFKIANSIKVFEQVCYLAQEIINEDAS